MEETRHEHCVRLLASPLILDFTAVVNLAMESTPKRKEKPAACLMSSTQPAVTSALFAWLEIVNRGLPPTVKGGMSMINATGNAS